MDEVSLSPEQEAEAQRIEDTLKAAALAIRVGSFQIGPTNFQSVPAAGI